jgi:tetratricopeptide (TPR) repeat protein
MGVVVVALVVTAVVVIPRFRSTPPIVVPEPGRNVDSEVDKLIARFTRLVEEDKRDPHRRARLGLVFEANEMWAEAVQSYENWKSLGGTDPIWLYHQALCIRQAGDFDRAMAQLKRIAEENPTLAPVHYRLGQWLLESGDPDQAAERFRVAAAMMPDAVEPMVGLGTSLAQMGEFQAAVKQLEPAVAQDPAYKPGLYALGLAYRGLGRADDARGFLNRGINAKPRFLVDSLTSDLREMTVNLTELLDRAKKLIEAGNAALAAKKLEARLRNKPDDINILTNLAAAYRAMKQYDRAMGLLESSVKIDPTHFAGYLNLCLCALDQNMLEEGLRYADLAVKHGGTVGQTHLARARSLARLGRYEESLASLETAARLDARDPELFLALGETYARFQRYQEAKVSFQKGSDLDPLSFLLWLKLSVAAIRTEDMELARYAHAKAEKLAPEDREVQNVGRIIEQMTGG